MPSLLNLGQWIFFVYKYISVVLFLVYIYWFIEG